MSAERRRLDEIREGVPWRKWGPYLAERQWGTVREDYSADGDAWSYLPHDHARSRAYRWGEDGIAGFSDDRQRLCLSLALWNRRDSILKERLFGVSGHEGNHGEDVKEVYYFLDGLPSHAYMKMLYKYPQAAFPYAALLEENRRRSRLEGEFDLHDTGIFDDDRYFDVFVEFAKDGPEDLLVRVTAWNRGPSQAPLELLPHLVFRNTWAWDDAEVRPQLAERDRAVLASHPELGEYRIAFDGAPELLFTENETNAATLFGKDHGPGPFKDAFHDYVVGGKRNAPSSKGRGTKAAARYAFPIPPGGSVAVRYRMAPAEAFPEDPFGAFDETLDQRGREADEFHEELQRDLTDPDARAVQRQALAGMLWTKQFYHYDVRRWLAGDPAQPAPAASRRRVRNTHWQHLRNAEVVSMPDTWEYPWYAAWDLAFHCLPLALVDPEFAKEQLLLMTRTSYMHPNGQLPAYEWSFEDVNPPVHAWAAWRVYKIDACRTGTPDLVFLERILHKMLLNFTWWVNRKDHHGNNLFEGGFLGFDNIGVFDRSAELPTGGHIEQADATSWMGMFCLNLMRMALELAKHNPVYQDLAAKFFEHFLYIAGAMKNIGGDGIDLWNEEDEFFYDVLHFSDGHDPSERGHEVHLRVRSMVGLSPLFAVEVLEPELLEKVPRFKRQLETLLEERPDLASLISRWYEPGKGERRLLSLLRGHRMKCLLRRMLDEGEFLSDHGVRSLSKHHLEHPYEFRVDGNAHTVRYQPAESDSPMFGGNSNWRGPVWFPVNFLMVEALQRFHHYYGDDFRIELPTGSGRYATLLEASDEIALRLTRIFLRGSNGRRPALGTWEKHQVDPHFRDLVPFHEYFHGDDGHGLGASHQTGWTGLVAKLLQPRRSPGSC